VLFVWSSLSFGNNVTGYWALQENGYWASVQNG
jgi:hypothetical protein